MPPDQPRLGPPLDQFRVQIAGDMVAFNPAHHALGQITKLALHLVPLQRGVANRAELFGKIANPAIIQRHARFPGAFRIGEVLLYIGIGEEIRLQSPHAFDIAKADLAALIVIIQKPLIHHFGVTQPEGIVEGLPRHPFRWPIMAKAQEFKNRRL